MFLCFQTEEDGLAYLSIANIDAMVEVEDENTREPFVQVHMAGGSVITIKGGLKENMKRIEEEISKIRILAAQIPGMVGR